MTGEGLEPRRAEGGRWDGKRAPQAIRSHGVLMFVNKHILLWFGVAIFKTPWR